MTNSNCPNCNSPISIDAVSCPQCGNKIKIDKYLIRARSIDSLQRLYSLVISACIVISLYNLFIDDQTRKIILPDSNRFLLFLSFIFTVIPFFHGTSRYLDATYVTQEREARKGMLMVDFGILFIQGIVFFIIAALLKLSNENTPIFYYVLSGLLILDIAWVIFTKIFEKRDIGVLSYITHMIKILTNSILELFKNDEESKTFLKQRSNLYLQWMIVNFFVSIFIIFYTFIFTHRWLIFLIFLGLFIFYLIIKYYIKYKMKFTIHKRWYIIQTLIIILLLLFELNNYFGTIINVSSIKYEFVLTTVLFLRTIYDYMVVWEFYYPGENPIPIPAPVSETLKNSV